MRFVVTEKKNKIDLIFFLILFIKIYKKIVLTKPHGRYLEERFFLADGH
jgi:hypothetical protein